MPRFHRYDTKNTIYMRTNRCRNSSKLSTVLQRHCYEKKKVKRNPSALLVGMPIGEATVENSMEFPQKTKNGTAL